MTEEPTITPTELAYDMGLIDAWEVKHAKWMGKHVWRGKSMTATRITDVCDRIADRWPRLETLCGWVVAVLGTGNYFS